MIVVEQASEPGPACDFASAVVVRHLGHRPDDLTVESLMVALPMVVSNEFAQKMA